MRSLSVTLCFVLATLTAQAAPKYPMVIEVRGKVLSSNSEGKENFLKKMPVVLVEKATLVTEDSAEAVLVLDAHRSLRLYGKSRLEIPSISWETGEAPILILKQGRFRWTEEAPKAYNIALRSELFEFLSPPGDFVFSFDPKAATAEVKALKGQMEFSAMNGDETALVTAGQKVTFQGVREGEEIVYDVLLKGKKIPRGKLGLVQPLTAEEQKAYSGAQEKAAIAARQKKAVAQKKLEKKLQDPQAICIAPSARLNQCAWLCDGNPAKEKKICQLEKPGVRCLRKRCNANGEWSEETEIPKDKASSLCGVAPLIKDCDY